MRIIWIYVYTQKLKPILFLLVLKRIMIFTFWLNSKNESNRCIFTKNNITTLNWFYRFLKLETNFWTTLNCQWVGTNLAWHWFFHFSGINIWFFNYDFRVFTQAKQFLFCENGGYEASSLHPESKIKQIIQIELNISFKCFWKKKRVYFNTKQI